MRLHFPLILEVLSPTFRWGEWGHNNSLLNLMQPPYIPRMSMNSVSYSGGHRPSETATLSTTTYTDWVLPRAGLWSGFFVCTTWFNPQSDSIRRVPPLALLYRWENRGSKAGGESHKLAQIGWEREAWTPGPTALLTIPPWGFCWKGAYPLKAWLSLSGIHRPPKSIVAPPHGGSRGPGKARQCLA